MSLSFPNLMRAYDGTRHAVRFWGHDSAMEACFFVSEEALRRVEPGMSPDEDSVLHAFDRHRERIHAAAARVYGRGRKGSYDIGKADL